MIEALIFVLGAVQAGTIVYLVWDYREGREKGEDCARRIAREARLRWSAWRD